MSFFDASSMIPVYAPVLTPVPTQPANSAVPEAQGGGAQDSTSSSSGSLAQQAQAAVDVVELSRSGGHGGGRRQAGSDSPETEAEAAAAVVDLDGASSITVDDYRLSVPPNLATATQLVDQLTAGTTLSAVALGAAFQLLSPAAALALTTG